MSCDYYDDGDIKNLIRDVSEVNVDVSDMDVRLMRIERMLWLMVSNFYTPGPASPPEWEKLYDQLAKEMGE